MRSNAGIIVEVHMHTNSRLLLWNNVIKATDIIKFDCNNIITSILRLLTGCFILVGSLMFGVTFNLVTRVGLLYFLGTVKYSCLNSLPLNNGCSYKNILQNGVNFYFVQISPICGPSTY